MQYRKKPVVIEAFQYDGDLSNDQGYYVPEWAAKAFENGDLFYEGHGDLYIRTLEGKMLASIGDYIIKGVDGEFYPCKPDIFEKTYETADTKHDNLTFGQALEALKQGERVTRKGWNGKGQYIELATCISYVNSEGKVINPQHKSMGNNAIAFVGTSGVQLGWLASQADMLAEDWEVIE